MLSETKPRSFVLFHSSFISAEAEDECITPQTLNILLLPTQDQLKCTMLLAFIITTVMIQTTTLQYILVENMSSLLQTRCILIDI